MVEAWHFVNETLRDGSPVPPDGETLKFDGPLELCASGYHASERIIDALKYAPGNTICRVRCGGDFIRDYDKFVCSERTILWRVDGESILRDFARRQALTVAHLWEMPNVVRQYLETGDESLRGAAWGAARDAARDAAWGAAWGAARDAALGAAWGAALGAAWGAALGAARDAAWDAALGAAWDAALGAAWGAAWDAANETLTKMINEAHNG